MVAVKLDVSVPSEIRDRLKRVAPAGKRSTFVAEAIREKLEAIERERFEAKLEAGYREMAEEHARLAAAAFADQSTVATRGG